jgi:glycosyltransferase involved in cell wall biosynthesis
VEHTETSTLRVVYVGRIHLTKGIDVLIQACDQVAGEAPISLTVIGDGPESDALKARWGAKPWVTFMGRLVHQQISDLMKQSDVLSAPSIWPENYPGVVAHALGQGLPVIGSDIGGIPELVRDDVNGFLVPPGNVDALRRALGKLAKDRQCLNRIKRQTEGQKALFDPERNAERIFAFAEQLRTGVVSYA